MTDWDGRFIELAQHVASWSKDPKCKVGAVLVSPDKHQIVPGYNGFPRGVKDYDTRLEDKYTKNTLTVHAELNAILNARQSVAGWTLYCTKAICADCAKAIIQAGITKVVSPATPDSSSWAASCRVGATIMDEAQIVRITF